MPEPYYEMPPKSGLRVPAGDSRCFPLRFPSRTIIDKILVVQEGGPAANFTVSLYNANAPCQGISQSDSEGDEVGPLSPDIYRVTTDLAANTYHGPGRLLYFAEEHGGKGYPFFNHSREMPGARLGNPRELYLKIDNPAGVELVFSVVLGAVTI